MDFRKIERHEDTARELEAQYRAMASLARTLGDIAKEVEKTRRVQIAETMKHGRKLASSYDAAKSAAYWRYRDILRGPRYCLTSGLLKHMVSMGEAEREVDRDIGKKDAIFDKAYQRAQQLSPGPAGLAMGLMSGIAGAVLTGPSSTHYLPGGHESLPPGEANQEVDLESMLRQMRAQQT